MEQKDYILDGICIIGGVNKTGFVAQDPFHQPVLELGGVIPDVMVNPLAQ